MKNKLRCFFIALALLAGIKQTAAQVTFTLTSSPAVGSRPYSLVLTNVNGDGELYLICANSAGNTLSVLTNNGSGVFGSNATLIVGNAPTSVTAADVNGDHKLDLISANAGDDTLTILTNNGSGVFGSNATINASTVSHGPRSVTVVDINGDGKVDLISPNYDDPGTISVWTNNGGGVFGSNATINVGALPVYVVAADINGDHKLDLICVNQGDNTLSVLTNNGSGIFGSNATLNVGSLPQSCLAADVNGDGKPDLIAANWGGNSGNVNTLTVWTNNGSGIFGFNTNLIVGYGPYSIAAVDIDGDGKMDLVSANQSSSTLSVLTNNGSGVFASKATINVGFHPVYVLAADINGDNRPDLICANYYDNTLSILLNTTNQLLQATNSPLEVTTISLPTNGVMGVFFSAQIQVSGGDPFSSGFPYGGYLLSGSYPPGLDASTGDYTSSSGIFVLSGTPTQSGIFSFAAVAFDADGNQVTNTTSITINPLLFAPTTISGGKFQLSLNGNAGNYYTILFSTDLINWSPLLITNPPSAQPLYLDFPMTNKTGFYKAYQSGIVIGQSDFSFGTIAVGTPVVYANVTNGFAVIPVTRTNGLADDVCVNYSTTDGTADGGCDYTPVSGTLCFAPNVTSNNISIPISLGCSTNQSPTINVQLSDPNGTNVINVAVVIQRPKPVLAVYPTSLTLDVPDNSPKTLTIINAGPPGSVLNYLVADDGVFSGFLNLNNEGPFASGSLQAGETAQIAFTVLDQFANDWIGGALTTAVNIYTPGAANYTKFPISVTIETNQTSLVPASLAGLTSEEDGGDTVITYNDDGTFILTDNEDNVLTGTYTWRPYSLNGATLQLNYDDGGVSFIEVTFTDASDGTYSATFYDGLGDPPDTGTGTFTIQ
jgi:hypothetical protein